MENLNKKDFEVQAMRRKFLEALQKDSEPVKIETVSEGENLKKEIYLKLRINSVEKERLTKIERLTARKKSDIVREALFRFIKSDYPEFL